MIAVGDVYLGWANPPDNTICNPPPDPTNDSNYHWTYTVHFGSPRVNNTDKDMKNGGNQCDNKPPMAQYSVHSMMVSLNIEDRPLRYSPPRGPAIDFLVTYNQKDTQQPASFAYSNLGRKWDFQLAFICDR